MYDLSTIDREALEAAFTPAPGEATPGCESAFMYGQCVVELMEAASLLQRFVAGESKEDVAAARIQAGYLLRRLGQQIPAPKPRKTLGLRLSR